MTTEYKANIQAPKIPQMLYHYTTVESLVQILEGHNIRFSPLDKMDDLQEKEARDLKNAGQYIFVSSWTSNGEESIPMWKMYASLESGVMIGLPTNPFKVYNLTYGDVCEIAEIKGQFLNPDDIFRKSIIPAKITKQGDFFSPDMAADQTGFEEPIKIEYTNDERKLCPEVLIIENGKKVGLNYNELGRYKNTAWSFQDEWRYGLSILPGRATDYAQLNEKFEKVWSEICDNETSRPLSYYDREIRDDAYKKMTITKSPCLSEANEIIINEFVRKNNPGVIINDSSLKGKIR